MKESLNNNDVFKILGKNIKKIRCSQGISQEKLAEQINKSSHFISLLERGASGISIPTLIDICQTLKIDANTVFDNIIHTNNVNPNNLLTKSFNSFDKKDREMVSYLINYINSKN